jgi:hypothetical protein
MLLLYSQVPDWLRLVLDGLPGNLPAAFDEVCQRITIHDIIQQDIEEYFVRFFKSIGVESEEGARVAAIRFMRRYNELRGQNDALKQLALLILEESNLYIH